MKKIIFCLFFISTVAFSQQPLKVLFIGNSYTNTYNTPGDIPTMFRDLAAAGGHSVTVQMQAPNGVWLSDHIATLATINAIKSAKWDYVVLQEGSTVPSSDYVSSSFYGKTGVALFTESVDSLKKIITANDSCTQTLLFMTWGWKYGDSYYPGGDNFTDMTHRLDVGYLTPSNLYNLKVVPVGRVWENVVNTTTLNLYNSDNYHPNIYGSYITACSFYSAIYNSSPLNLSYVPSGISQTEANAIQTEAASFITNNTNRNTYRLNNASKCSGLAGFKKNELPSLAVSIYPNPTNGVFNIASNNKEYKELSISIVDIHGKEVYRELNKNVTTEFNKQINVSHLSKGMYYVKLNTGTESSIQKIVIQ